MKFSSIRCLSIVFVSCLLVSCAAVGLKDDVVETPTVTAESYAENGKNKGVVLLDVNWGRKWGCGAYENAQIITFSFDKMPSGPRAKEAAADFVLTTPNRLLVDPKFISYAFLLDPGKYALSYTKVKAARSASDVGHFTADRSRLLKDGKSHGRFHVDAGETVYIGNFFLDCHQQPKLWRYYTTREKFPGHVDEYKKAYPFLDLNNVIYRLFETDVFGQPHTPK